MLELPGNRRYDYFVKRAASHGELWGLHGEGAWVVAADDEAVLSPFGRIRVFGGMRDRPVGNGKAGRDRH